MQDSASLVKGVRRWVRWARSTQPLSLGERGGSTKRRMPRSRQACSKRGERVDMPPQISPFAQASRERSREGTQAEML